MKSTLWFSEFGRSRHRVWPLPPSLGALRRWWPVFKCIRVLGCQYYQTLWVLCSASGSDTRTWFSRNGFGHGWSGVLRHISTSLAITEWGLGVHSWFMTSCTLVRLFGAGRSLVLLHFVVMSNMFPVVLHMFCLVESAEDQVLKSRIVFWFSWWLVFPQIFHTVSPNQERTVWPWTVMALPSSPFRAVASSHVIERVDQAKIMQEHTPPDKAFGPKNCVIFFFVVPTPFVEIFKKMSSSHSFVSHCRSVRSVLKLKMCFMIIPWGADSIQSETS